MCASYSVLPVVVNHCLWQNLSMARTPSPYGKWQIETRKRVGVSQQRLAEMSGIDRGHISKIETGKVELPLRETRDKIHAVLGTSEQELVELGIVEGHGISAVNDSPEIYGVHQDGDDLRAQAHAIIERMDIAHVRFSLTVLTGLERGVTGADLAVLGRRQPPTSQ